MNWLILSLIIFSGNIFSAESFLCIEKGQSAQSAFVYLSDFLLPKDRAYANVDTNCIEISGAESRRDFLNDILAKRFKLTSFISSSASNASNAEHCEMQITQKSQNKGTGTSGRFGSNTGATAFESKGETTSVSSLTGLSGEPVQFTAYGEAVNITCKVMARGRYEIKVSLSSVSTSASLATSVNVNKGEMINLGELVKEAKNNNRNIDINQGVGASVTNDTSTSRYELVIK
jgi:hypothetical protein